MTLAPELILHLGAHRTGSTALQETLVAGQRSLERSGLRVLVHSELGRIPGFAKVGRTGDPAPARAALAAACAGADRVLISEENLIGDMGWNIRSGSFYHRAGDRLAAYRDVFATAPKRIGLGIRGYAEYWISAHAFELSYRRLGDKKPVRFADSKAALAATERGWLDLIDDVRATFPGAEIHVWPAEAGVTAPDLVRRLTGLSNLVLAAPAARVNAAPVAGFIPAMEAKRAAEPDLTRSQMWDWLTGQVPGGFEGFSVGEIERMATRYADDLRALASGYAGVNLIARDAEVTV